MCRAWPEANRAEMVGWWRHTRTLHEPGLYMGLFGSRIRHTTTRDRIRRTRADPGGPGRTRADPGGPDTSGLIEHVQNNQTWPRSADALSAAQSASQGPGQPMG